MPFLFVHGVNVRRGVDYDREQTLRNGFLTSYVGPETGMRKRGAGGPPLVFAPYWGDRGVRFWKQLEVVPDEAGEVFGELPPSLGVLRAGEDPKEQIRNLSAADPVAFLDLLFDAAAVGAQDDADAQAIAVAYRAAQHKLETDASREWLRPGAEVEASARAIHKTLTQPATLAAAASESFGPEHLFDRLQEAADRLTNAIPDQLAGAAVKAFRKPLTRAVATFLGDSFAYLSERGDGAAPGPIASMVLQELRQASAVARAQEEPLVVICHSFGGEIVYDLLTHYARDEGLKIDHWVTVGSQVGLFEEMSLYMARRGPKHDTEAVPMPAAVQRWLNVYDLNDVLSFRVVPVFTAGGGARTVADYFYDTGLPFTGAHSGYWRWPSFYRRLTARMQEGGTK